MAGFYAVVMLKTFLSHGGPCDGFLLFILPLLRVSTIVLSSVLLVNFVYAYGPARAACAAALLCMPLLTAAAAAAHATNRTVLSVLLGIVAIAAAVVGWFWLRE